MEKSSPYREIVQKNEKLLSLLKEDGLITRDEIRAMMNFKNGYSLKDQEAAFLKFKNFFQNKSKLQKKN